MILAQPWPVVEDFLRSLSPGSVGLDVGCGNGKYLPVSDEISIVGSDRYVICIGALKVIRPPGDRCFS